jgi:hypothetical protein
MSKVVFFKPNSKATGAFASFSVKVEKDKPAEVFLTINKQVSWDDNTKKGSFKTDNPDDFISVKLNNVELASMIRAIDDIESFSTVHVFNENKTSIMFQGYLFGNPQKKAYGLSISKGDNKFKISFSPSEAYVLRRFLDNAIDTIAYNAP